MEKRQLFHSKAHQYLLLLIAFALPTAQLVPVFIVLLLLNWLVEGDLKNKMTAVFKNKFAISFIAFYLLHVIGLLYTVNMPAGLFDLEIKLSLLIFPLILASRPVKGQQLNRVLFALTLGCCLSLLVMLIRATVIYFTSGENNFYYQALSFFIHPSYISMYVNVCIAWIGYHVINKSTPVTGFSRVVLFFILLFFMLMTVLLSSKMGFLTLLLLVVGFLVYYVIKMKRYKTGITGLALIMVILAGIWYGVPEFKGRVERAVTAVTAGSADKTDGESTAVRMLIWKAANKVIAENPVIGTGTGDSKDELMKEYEREGITGAIEHKLNAHNEFYQVFVTLGLIGFLLLLFNLFAPLFNAIKTHRAVYTLFLAIVIFNFLTESMLETQAGVVFYAFFNSLLCFAAADKQNASGTLNHG